LSALKDKRPAKIRKREREKERGKAGERKESQTKYCHGQPGVCERNGEKTKKTRVSKKLQPTKKKKKKKKKVSCHHLFSSLLFFFFFFSRDVTTGRRGHDAPTSDERRKRKAVGAGGVGSPNGRRAALQLKRVSIRGQL
jgi:hypothetical protein